jgi:hypothetical protein
LIRRGRLKWFGISVVICSIRVDLFRPINVIKTGSNLTTSCKRGIEKLNKNGFDGNPGILLALD